MSIELPSDIAAHSDRNPPPSNRQFLKLLTVVVGMLLAISLALPRVVDVIVWGMPTGLEQQLGQVMAPAYEAMAKPSPTQTALQQLLDRLVAELPEKHRQGRNYKLLYVNDATINAGAVPGDRILVFRGLLKQATSENELAMVLGHELGHFAHRDHLRGLGQQLLLQLSVSWLFGDVGALQSIATSGVVALNQAQFSQRQERQADEMGLTLLQRLYGHVAGATDFFDRLKQQEPSTVDWLLSHPAPSKRVETLRQLIHERGYNIQAITPLQLPLKQ